MGFWLASETSKSYKQSAPSKAHDQRVHHTQSSSVYNPNASRHPVGHRYNGPPLPPTSQHNAHDRGPQLVNTYHNVYDTRSVSPPRCKAEQPRPNYHLYSDHRSVSPLGSSRFEKPTSYSSSAKKTHDVRGASGSNTRSRTNTLSRSEKVYTRLTRFQTSDARLGYTRRPQLDPNFRSGGVIDWKEY